MWRSLVTFVGVDPNRHLASILGSGFIAGGSGDHVVVLSAAHIFVDWLERVVPDTMSAFRGLEGDAKEFAKRMFRAAKELRAFEAVLDFGPSVGPRTATFSAFSLTHNYRRNDTAIVILELPKNLPSPRTVATTYLDTTPFTANQPVFMAGIIGGEIEMTPARQLLKVGRALAVHVGYIVDRVPSADGYGIPMYCANMPSLGGMSGGPAFVLRKTIDEQEMPTAIGIVSSERLPPGGAIELPEHCEDGETWVSPIGHAYGSLLQTADFGVISLQEVIGRGLVDDYEAYLRAQGAGSP